MQDIKKNIQKIRAEIAAELKKSGREGEDITLVAVTKTHPVEAIDIALSGGISHFGENKVQEAVRKMPMISQPYDGFHFIGHLQSNKINQLLALKPLLIHSIGSLHLANKLHRALGRTNRSQEILIQVNVTAEESKSGVSFANAREMIYKIAGFSTLYVRGLMTIGKLDPDPEVSRPYFKQLKALFDEIRQNSPEGFDYLSMGMSHDWQIALQEGSNMLRIGSAIFGKRDYGAKQ
ncbi:MAG: YggS family pyridoxal phosphate-dependent enzyme [Candidatus Cloacimonadaceae bacterium]|jgi:pyridoxal phosphate enzyme (YggS family)|nr:YggS family pyridoxal phosphate-dependent enzyme [Candidatus Cloacimonadota bacterium]MDY0127366.1 YggS family pyridoxal phosphate-dependent enzyme [Candidatus Cloacimonadaceae bacterium]MCB5255322.1 YggS family pyridoxal phosphate-dependent enzyme [Candidatus Cloacimonadota bacterium]MCK9178533.1 YggS family pyridoxal phosphate-dependent enzyme [Candidatus Cloacimonadota bacterium]MCK9242635.1 YggS family pyridoxal phosphate-dependent enzyme [Candidatus Cloacimonadota bacterium]